ncbi:MAG: DNA topoisomerase I, partial [Nanoarchaeota archaeon]
KQLPIFDVKWTPNYQALKKDFTKKYYTVLAALAKKASKFTVATDYDIEGEVIGLNIIRYICNQTDANRMKFSTLTTKELQEAYDNKSQSLNWSQGIAGETRHFLDWFYGINLSRALMEAIKKAGSFKIMSIGRVQGPTLNLIVKKEREIQAFKPQKYFQVFINIDKHNLELKYIKDIFEQEKSFLEKFKNLEEKEVQVQTTKDEQKIIPGFPFDLTTLQTEAYKFYGLTPAKTLQIAQSLYLAGLISYPRTSSQKLPPSIAYQSILEKVAKDYNAEKYISKKFPIEGKKTDPAHPSIYPTGETSDNLIADEKKIYDLIVRRFLALFCSDAIIYNKKIEAEINELKFNTRGMSIKERGFLNVYPIKLQEKELPDINGTAKITNIRNEEKETQPPKRYSPASIVSELEKRNLGTKATRANIIETLYDRGYIKERSIEATPLGISLISTLEKYSPIIINEQLTRELEKEADNLLKSSKDLNTKEEKIINHAKEIIKKIIQQFNENNEKIGLSLLEANKELREYEKKANEIMLCPICKIGQLAVTFSRKNKKYFIACNAYPNCKTTFSLPPTAGLIKKAEKQCPSCNFPLLISIRKGSRPWIFCFNPACPSRQKKNHIIKNNNE